MNHISLARASQGLTQDINTIHTFSGRALRSWSPHGTPWDMRVASQLTHQQAVTETLKSSDIIYQHDKHEKQHPSSPTAPEAPSAELSFPSSLLSLPLSPKHRIPRLPKSVHIANLAPINYTPEPPQILLLAPHPQAGAHPRMLVDADAHERADIIARPAEELGRAELFAVVRPADELAGCHVPLWHRRRTGVVEVRLPLGLRARGPLRRGREQVPGGGGAVLLREWLERLVPRQWGLRELDG